MPELQAEASSAPEQALQAQAQVPLTLEHAGGQELVEQTAQPPAIRDREAAIQAGILIDVTPTALQLGITFPVTITRPLWESGNCHVSGILRRDQTNRCATSHGVPFAFGWPDHSVATDRLSSAAGLATEPGTEPVLLFALIQADPTHQAQTATLLSPNAGVAVHHLTELGRMLKKSASSLFLPRESIL